MAARVLSSVLPSLDYPILDYVTSLFAEADPSDQPIISFIRPLLESESIPEEDIVLLCITLQSLWDAQTGGKEEREPTKLDRVLDMRRQEALSKHSALIEVVDIESTVKARDTQVNIAKLVKAEAKIKAKMEKRNAKSSYEGSKLMDASRQQVSTYIVLRSRRSTLTNISICH